MNIYISKDHEGKPTAVLLAEDKTYAYVALEAMGTPMHTVEEINPGAIDFNDLAKVKYLLTSEECRIQDIPVSHDTYRKFKRGK